MSLYTCEIKGSGAALDAHLNEYHIYSSRGAGHNYTTNMRAWMGQKNELRIKVHQSAKAYKDQSVQFTVLATIAESRHRRTLCNMSFPAGIVDPTTLALPFDTYGKPLSIGQSLRFTCDDANFILEKPWKDGRPIKNPTDIYTLYAEIQNCFVEGDVDKIMKLSTARITYCAMLYEFTRPDFERKVLNDLSSTLASQPRWKVVRQPERDLTIHEFLPGKVVRVLDLFGNPPLRTLPDKDGVQFGYDIIIASTAEGLVWIM